MTNEADKPSVEGLKPCPFCGYEQCAVIPDADADGPMYSGYCPYCDTEGPVVYSTAQKMAVEGDAVAAWNRRASEAAQPATPLREVLSDPIRELLMQHATLIEEGNDYAYFELAYTRLTGWMAWLTDRPASGEPGTAAYAKSRNVIARGQGDSPDEACADALAALRSRLDGEKT